MERRRARARTRCSARAPAACIALMRAAPTDLLSSMPDECPGCARLRLESCVHRRQTRCHSHGETAFAGIMQMHGRPSRTVLPLLPSRSKHARTMSYVANAMDCHVVSLCLKQADTCAGILQLPVHPWTVNCSSSYLLGDCVDARRRVVEEKGVSIKISTNNKLEKSRGLTIEGKYARSSDSWKVVEAFGILSTMTSRW